MPRPLSTALVDYVNKQLKLNNMSRRKMTRQIDVSHTTFNKLAEGDLDSRITADAIIIAHGLRCDPVHMLKLGGFLKPEPAQTTREREFLTSFRRLSGEAQQTALMLTDFLFEHRGKLPWRW